MASASVEQENAPYFGVTVSFGEKIFFQIIISYLIGADFTALLQNYANEYEQQWIAQFGQVSEPN